MLIRLNHCAEQYHGQYRAVERPRLRDAAAIQKDIVQVDIVPSKLVATSKDGAIMQLTALKPLFCYEFNSFIGFVRTSQKANRDVYLYSKLEA